MKKIQVIGGSGFIGSNLISRIKNRFTVCNIDKANSSEFPSITTITDVRNKEKLDEALQPSDWIVLLAAEHRDDVTPVSLYYDVNVEGAKNVLAVMNDKKINKILFTSTVAVYGLNKKNPDESFKEDPFNDYGKSKWQAEEVLRSWYNEDAPNRSLIILRPTVVFGPKNRGNVYNLLKQISSGKFLRIGKGNNKKSMAYVDNITSFIEYCLTKDLTGYHLFNYADKPDLTTNELLQTVEKLIDKKLPRVRIPYVLGYTGGLAFDVFSKITGKKTSISSVRVKKFCATTEFSSSKINATGFKPAYDLKEGI
ncbi:MAG: NAD-dependent epimerase/dehydratase family protein, partial [Parafilimonas sp.]